MKDMNEDQVRGAVRERYAKIATLQGGSCCGGGSSCCSVDEMAATSAHLGYSSAELEAVPAGSNLGLGCGNPQAIAALQPGETVLDLGSGAGFDCFLAARQVGAEGRVIGVDMTPDMLSRARANAEEGGYANVDFRLGEIEHLPVADGSVDVILSNCVINLSPDKGQVFREAHRVLKPGGRLAISDVVALQALPEALRHDLDAYGGCVAGAAQVGEVEELLRAVGFRDVQVRVKEESRAFIQEWFPGSGAEAYVASATIEARRQ
ncbi:MAG: arsenite methyltransferase [Candidatus Delongbacteria bacterium]